MLIKEKLDMIKNKLYVICVLIICLSAGLLVNCESRNNESSFINNKNSLLKKKIQTRYHHFEQIDVFFLDKVHRIKNEFDELRQNVNDKSFFVTNNFDDFHWISQYVNSCKCERDYIELLSDKTPEHLENTFLTIENEVLTFFVEDYIYSETFDVLQVGMTMEEENDSLDLNFFLMAGNAFNPAYIIVGKDTIRPENDSELKISYKLHNSNIDEIIEGVYVSNWAFGSTEFNFSVGESR